MAHFRRPRSQGRQGRIEKNEDTSIGHPVPTVKGLGRRVSDRDGCPGIVTVTLS